MSPVVVPIHSSVVLDDLYQVALTMSLRGARINSIKENFITSIMPVHIANANSLTEEGCRRR